MNTYLNYLIEANVGLIAFLVAHAVFLQRETNFQFKRFFILGGIVLSLLLPCIHFNVSNQFIPTVRDVVPTNWLPEVTIGNNTPVEKPISGWSVAGYFYLGGLLIFMIRFIIRLCQLLLMIRQSETRRTGMFRIASSTKNKSTFSFFHFIFIGQADRLSEEETQQIIAHESVHARKWHSADIVLVNTLGILFWFNPFIRIYRRILIQLHEFEADAHVAESRDKNEYCSLLAKVALLSADFTLANHFNNSLTLKRISMMRTIKQKIKMWKMVAVTSVLPLLFFILSCQDQLVPNTVIKTDNLEAEVEKRFAKFREERKSHPGTIATFSNYDELKLGDSTDNYYMESFTILDGGKLKKYSIVQFFHGFPFDFESSPKEEEVFTVVEHSPDYSDNGRQGMNQLVQFISSEMKYPEKARIDKKEGTVFVQFIVEKDGAVSDIKVIRGVEPSMDAEALRVVALTKWTPGMQNGKAVRVRFVLPIKYKL